MIRAAPQENENKKRRLKACLITLTLIDLHKAGLQPATLFFDTT
jgi:hypothetical protein